MDQILVGGEDERKLDFLKLYSSQAVLFFLNFSEEILPVGPTLTFLASFTVFTSNQLILTFFKVGIVPSCNM